MISTTPFWIPFWFFFCSKKENLKGKGNLALDTRLEVDGGQLLDNLGGRVQVNETLVDLHLEAVPGLGTLTARGLAGGDAENLGGETDGSLDTEVLVLGTLDKVRADLLEVLDVAGGQGDADAVNGRLDVLLDTGLGRLLDGRHDWMMSRLSESNDYRVNVGIWEGRNRCSPQGQILYGQLFFFLPFCLGLHKPPFACWRVNHTII